jgi:phosphohistidine phosphatase
MPSNKNIIILRHGQAKNAGMNDHDHSRPLTLKGREEAASSGETLLDNGYIVDHVLCSTAVRTRETLIELQKSFTDPLVVEYIPQIYNAFESDLLMQIATVSNDIKTLLLIGHNPALYQLSLTLAKEGDKQMHDNLQMQFPTCALVVINFDGTWQDIINARSKLILFSTPDT